MANSSHVRYAVRSSASSDRDRLARSPNTLHTSHSSRLALSIGNTDSFGTTPKLVSSAFVPYKDKWAGTSIYFQAAFENSKTKQLTLSIASKIVLRVKQNCPKACVVYRFNIGSSTSPSWRYESPRLVDSSAAACGEGDGKVLAVSMAMLARWWSPSC